MDISTRSMLALAVSATALTACVAQGAPAATATTVTAAARADVEIPSTPAGKTTRWLLDARSRAPLTEAEIKEHVAAIFLEQIPPAKFNEILTGIKDMPVVRVADSQPSVLVLEVTMAGKASLLTVVVDAAGKLVGARVTGKPVPQPAPKSWKELDERMAKVAPRVGFAASEITRNGRCRTVHGISPRRPLGLGSMFKLYVLGAVARSGTPWDRKLTITAADKSLPSGVLQDQPAGSRVTLFEAAKLMISISDNTAADLLLHHVGREAVEKVNRAWSRTGNTPFLTTRELFTIKGTGRTPAYLALDTPGRRAYLRDVVAKIPLSEVKPSGTPQDLDTIEWFGSPADVCRAHASLRRLDSPRVRQAMTAAEVLDLKGWSDVWYKGGSEQGLLDMGFSARSADGRTFFVTLMATNPSAPLDEGVVSEEFLALTKGALTLAARS